MTERMAPGHRAHVEKFRKAVEDLPGLWRSVEARILAVRVDGIWRNLMTRCSLLSLSPRRNPFQTIYNDETVGCWRCVLPISQLPSLLDGLQTGLMEFRSMQICYQQRSNYGEGPLVPYQAFFEFYNSERPYSVYNLHPLGVSALHLNATGDTTDGLMGLAGVDLTAFNQRLRISARPIDGLDALSQYVAGRNASVSQSCHVGFIAPFDVGIIEGQSSLRRGELRVTLRSDSPRYSRFCAINVFAPDPGATPIGRQIRIPTRRWKRVDARWEAQVCEDIGPVREVRVLVNYSGWAVEQRRIRDFTSTPDNSRVAAYNVFDNDLEKLREWLRPKGTRDSKHFELGIGRLLILCGYQADTFIESRQFTEGVDVVAHCPYTDTILAVECTVASLDSGGKLGKLIARANQLQGQVAEKSVWRVVCTALSRSDISDGELEDAAREQVIVLGADEISELLALAIESAGFDAIEQYILSCVPKSQNQTFY